MSKKINILNASKNKIVIPGLFNIPMGAYNLELTEDEFEKLEKWKENKYIKSLIDSKKLIIKESDTEFENDVNKANEKLIKEEMFEQENAYLVGLTSKELDAELEKRGLKTNSKMSKTDKLNSILESLEG